MQTFKCIFITASLVALVSCSTIRTKRQGDFRYIATDPHHGNIHEEGEYGYGGPYGDAPSHPLTNQLAPSGHPTIDALRGSASTYLASALGLAFGPFGSFVGAFSKPHLADAFYYLTNGALARSAAPVDEFGNVLQESDYQDTRSSSQFSDEEVLDAINLLS